MSRWRWSGGFPLRASPAPSSLPDLNGLTVVSLSLPQGTEAIKSDSGSLGHLKGLTRTHSHTPVTACRNIVSHLHCTPLGCRYAPRLVHTAAESVSTEGGQLANSSADGIQPQQGDTHGCTYVGRADSAYYII